MKKMMFVVALGTFALTGCENGAPKLGSKVEERTADQVAGCRFLGLVTSTPKLFGALKSVGQEDAERAARRSVKQEGGNVVVFDPLDPNAEVFQVTGRAYSC